MYGTKLKGQESKIYNNNDWDWREIIYQMAKDFNKYSQFDFFTSRVA
jgi:hypothetical protein